ncbi:MAG: hypothetical protein HONBIEJF_02658 [Fimbriimonadaceae bacterium]|nr:hypothetical protein [Fimbriimonadaceae bacterium]
MLVEVRVVKTTNKDGEDAWEVQVGAIDGSSETESFSFISEAQAVAFARDYASSNGDTDGVPHMVVM